MNDTDETIGEELARWGKVAWIETTGRTSGNPATAAVGFVDEPDGSLLVAAGSESADWALNLQRNPSCRVTIGDHTDAYFASAVNEAERNLAISELILKYGTPAERLGRGPVFRLTRQNADPG